MKYLIMIGLLLIAACGQQTPGGLQSSPSPSSPLTETPALTQEMLATESEATLSPSIPPTETPALTQEALATQTEATFQLPGGRLLFSALASEEVRNADPQHPRAHEYFWLNLPDLTVEPHPLLSGVYPIRDSGAVLSPDLSQLVFERETYTQSGDNLYSEVSSSIILTGPTDAVGSQIGQPFMGDALRGSAWSLDNHFFAYWRHLDWYGFENEHSIYLYELATGALKTITIQATQPDSASLSPDGSLITFSSYGDPLSLNLINADGSDQHVLVEGLIIGSVWHPDGKRIFYAQSYPESGMYSYDLSSNTIALITPTSDQVRWPDMSPDGSLLAYDDSGIVVVSPDGGTPVKLTQGMGMTEWAWSADSQYIAYISTQTSGIYVMDNRGNGKVPVYPDILMPYQMIGWLP